VVTLLPRPRVGTVAKAALLVVALVAGGACRSSDDAAGDATPAAPGPSPVADVEATHPAPEPDVADAPAPEVEPAATQEPEVAESPSDSPAESASPEPPEPPPARIESTPIPRSVPIPLEGTWTHEPSGVVFPVEAAGFRRVDAKRYDREGNDVEVDYRRLADGFPLVVSIYVYPVPRHADGRPMTFDEQFTDERNAVRHGRADLEVRGSSGARLAAEGILGGRGVVVRSEEYSFTMRAGAMSARVRSVLTSIRMDPWRLKYRVTLPEEHAEGSMARMEDLFASLDLPPTGLGEAKPILEEGR